MGNDLVNTQSSTEVQMFPTEFPRIVEPVTILSGSGSVVRGTVLGKITLGAASAAAKTGGNTGDGTLTLDETTPILAKAKAGVYTVRVKRAAIAQVGTTPAVPAQKAIVEFKDPDGIVLEVFELPTDPGVTISNHLKFAILEGSTAFVLGDGFDITVAAGSGKYKPYDKDNVDGSQKAVRILTQTVDATSADVKTSAWKSGHFNEAALTGVDATAKADFENTSIFIGAVV